MNGVKDSGETADDVCSQGERRTKSARLRARELGERRVVTSALLSVRSGSGRRQSREVGRASERQRVKQRVACLLTIGEVNRPHRICLGREPSRCFGIDGVLASKGRSQTLSAFERERPRASENERPEPSGD